MKIVFRQLVIFLVLPLAAFVYSGTIIAQRPVRDLKPTVILISFDGFRYDYLDRYGPPTLQALATGGVRAKWMTPSFPTKTFPNHYTIATGLYPEHHGIVENNVYDYGEVFTMSKLAEVENPRWWWGEPVWVTAEKQGQHSASYFFVGSGTAIEGKLPSYWRTYNGRVPPEMRVDKALAWLDKPVGERPTMISLYFSDTDDAGHEFGPEAEETKYAAWNVNRYISRLMDGLKRRKIDKKVNIIIVSDHGMAPVNVRNTTFLDDIFDFDLTEKILWTSEIVQIFPKSGMKDRIYEKIKALPHVTCWKKENIPERLHYNEGRRIAPIVCSSEEGWITTNHKWYDDWFASLDDKDHVRGAHGYDNRYPSMRATFIAHGEAFKKGYVAEPFENIEVYNLMCKILNLKPAPNDGDLSRVKGMLRGF